MSYLEVTHLPMQKYRKKSAEQSKADSGTAEVEMKRQVEFLLGIDHAVLNSCPACDQSLHNIHSILSYSVNPTFLNLTIDRL